MSSIANDNDTKASSNDLLQPFQLDTSNFRGRIVRLSDTLDDILKAHDYPKVVSRLLGDALVVTTLLGGMLKYEGVFTLQASSKGLIRLVVCDMLSDGTIRGYASFDEEEIKKLDPETEYSLKELMGEGYLAFTVDHKMADRYQGVVELQDNNFVQSINHYFEQSEQIMTSMKSAVALENNKWCAGALMLQKLPEQDQLQAVEKDDWIRSDIFLQSCKREELLDEALPLNDLLFRLFNEEGVIVFPPTELKKGCRCTRDRVISILTTLSEDDLDYAEKENGLEMVCEFCSKAYHFTKDEILEKRDEK